MAKGDLRTPKEVVALFRDGDDLVLRYKDGTTERIKDVEFRSWKDIYKNELPQPDNRPDGSRWEKP